MRAHHGGEPRRVAAVGAPLRARRTLAGALEFRCAKLGGSTCFVLRARWGFVARNSAVRFAPRGNLAAVQQDVLGLIQCGGEVVRAAAVRVEFLHQAAVGVDHVVARSIGGQAQHL